MSKVVSLAAHRRRSAYDIIDAAVANGQVLPLTVLLDNLHHWYALALRLEASKNPNDVTLARVARANAQRCAVDAAVYVHPRLAQTAVGGDPDVPLKVEHQFRLNANELKGKSIGELGQLYLALVKGDTEQLAELYPERADD